MTRSNNPQCVVSTCLTIQAYVDCVLKIAQGASACVDIQLANANGTPLDVNEWDRIDILLYDEYDCPIANYAWPTSETGCPAYLIDILQTENTDGIISNKGLIEICLSPVMTAQIQPSKIYAEIRLSRNDNPTKTTVIIIPCIWILTIVESKSNSLGCDSLFPGGIIPIAPIISNTIYTGNDDLLSDRTIGGGTGNHNLTFDLSKVTITGDLQVDGLIDPKGLILIDQVISPTSLDIGQGMIWTLLSDNRLYYQNSSNISKKILLEGDVTQTPVDGVTIEYNTAGELTIIVGPNGLQPGDNVSLLTNDTGYLTSIPNTYLETGDNVSLLTNDAGYLTSIPITPVDDITIVYNTAGELTVVNPINGLNPNKLIKSDINNDVVSTSISIDEFNVIDFGSGQIHNTPVSLEINTNGEVDWNLTGGQIATLSVDQNLTMNITNYKPGGTYILIIDWVDATSNIIWDNSLVLWPSGTEPNWSNTNGYTDVVTFISNGNIMLGSAVTEFQLNI